MAVNPTVPAPQTPPPSGDRGIGAPTPGGLSAAQQDAWTVLQQLLASYGFSGTALNQLVAWAKGQIISGNSATLITLNLQKTPQFEQRFPAIQTLANEGVAITPAEYISTEQAYAQLEQAAGLPPNFASYNQLIAMQVSPSEYADRITNGYLAVNQADPTVIQAFQDYYGVTKGQLAGYFLNPTKAEPLLKQQALAAQIGGAAAMAHFKGPQKIAGTGAEGVNQAEALRLAQLGVTQSAAQTGFQALSAEQQLYQPQVGQGQGAVGNPLTNDQLLNAQFGSDGQTKLQLELQAQFEKGTTEQGTQVGQTSTGATGLGVVQR